MSARSLPPNPSLRHLKLEAKSLLKAAHNGDQIVVSRIRAQMGSSREELKLGDAQQALAREYGFPS